VWYNSVDKSETMARSNNYLGIDFGAGGIKVLNVALEKKKAKLVTYGFTERSPEEAENDWFTDPQATANLLKKICAKAHTTTTQVITALPIASVFSAVINLPAAASKEVASAVRWEAKKLIPLPLEEVVLDWKLLPPAAGPRNSAAGQEKVKEKDKTIEVLLTGAPKTLINKYLDVFKKAGLNLLSLETEAFAFVRSLIGNDPSPTAIVDIGARKSNILILDRGVPFLTRSIDIGGKNFTQNIAAKLNIPTDQAEELKRNMSETELSGGIPDMIKEVLTPLLNEMKYSLDTYRARNNMTRSIEKIILTGGGAMLPKLTDYFTEFFNLRTFLGDPWVRLNYPEELKPVLQNIGSRFSVAIGLALREI